MPRKSAAELAIVRSDYQPPKPRVVKAPRTLGRPGKALWKSITREYDISSAADVELLGLICLAKDRAEACRARIDEDGELIDGKEHGLLKTELQTRSFITKALRQLGLE